MAGYCHRFVERGHLKGDVAGNDFSARAADGVLDRLSPLHAATGKVLWRTDILDDATFGADPDPAFAAMVADQFRYLLDRLDDTQRVDASLGLDPDRAEPPRQRDRGRPGQRTSPL